MSIFDKFIKQTLLINLDRRHDRLEASKLQLMEVGWSSWSRFSAIERHPVHVGFNRSQIECFKLLKDEVGPVAVLEDDIMFPFDLEQTEDIMELAISSLPHNWEVLYLGAMVFSGEFKGHRVGPNLVTAHGVVCTHGMIYNTGVLKRILDGFDRAAVYPVKSNIYDCWLANNYHRRGTCFLINPMVAWQAAGYSDLSNQASVGTGMFELTQMKIDKIHNR